MDKDIKNRLTVAIFLAGFLMLMAFNGRADEIDEPTYREPRSTEEFKPVSETNHVVVEEEIDSDEDEDLSVESPSNYEPTPEDLSLMEY